MIFSGRRSIMSPILSTMPLNASSTWYSLIFLGFLYIIYRSVTRISVSTVPGPESSSFLYGKALCYRFTAMSLTVLQVIFQNLCRRQPGRFARVSCHFLLQTLKHYFQTDFKWGALYGDVIRVTGPLKVNYVPSSSRISAHRTKQEDILLVSDPRALQYMLFSACYSFPKHAEHAAITRILFGGEGLVQAEGNVNSRRGLFSANSLHRRRSQEAAKGDASGVWDSRV